MRPRKYALNVEVGISMDVGFKLQKKGGETLKNKSITLPSFLNEYLPKHFCLVLQAYEMWAAGYTFFLLNNIYTSHWGFQKSSSRPSWRMKQMSFNYLKFRKFKKEVKLGISCKLHDTNYNLN